MLSLEADTLHDFKTDFSNVLTDTLAKMQKAGERLEGTVTAKIKITLYSRVNDLGVPYSEPLFVHEVTGSVPQKQTAKGELGGDYSLEYNAQAKSYTLRPADGGPNHAGRLHPNPEGVSCRVLYHRTLPRPPRPGRGHAENQTEREGTSGMNAGKRFEADWRDSIAKSGKRLVLPV